MSEASTDRGGSQYWVSGYPELIAEWDYERNGVLTPDQVTSGSGRMIWWRCPAGADHVWRAKPNNRSRGAGCPFCANKKVSLTNSLATCFPRVALEWHPAKNGHTTPADVVASSSRVCWWHCRASSAHEWRASVRDRTRGQTGCPYCAHRRPSPSFSLAAEHPALVEEWHWERNEGIRPDDIASGSSRVVWWRCRRVATHSWRASVSNRVRRASGCPHCARRVTHESES